MRRVAERAGMSKNTAYKCRDKLKRLNLIDWEQGEGKKHSCYYRFLLEDGTEAEVGRILEILKGNNLSKNRDSSSSCLKRETRAVPNLGHRRFLPNNSGQLEPQQSRGQNNLSEKEDTNHINQMNITNKISATRSLSNALLIREKRQFGQIVDFVCSKNPGHTEREVIDRLCEDKGFYEKAKENAVKAGVISE